MKTFNIDHAYSDLLKEIVYGDFAYNYEDPNRKGVIRREISSYKIQHNLLSGFPALTTKKLYWKGVVGELLWFLRGDTNINYLLENNINIWNKDAYNFSFINLIMNKEIYIPIITFLILILISLIIRKAFFK